MEDIRIILDKEKKERDDVKLLQVETSTSKIYQTNFFSTYKIIIDITLLFVQHSRQEFLSSFDRYFRFAKLSSIVGASPVLISTSSSLLLASSSSSSLPLSLSEANSFRSPHSFLRYLTTKDWTVEVTMDWKFQLNIVFAVKKRLSNGWLKN